ncbi:major capsid protein [robinz microvirus RP_152]|nr:major capsid protein [robinz microvirus RP_152]
MKRSKMSLSYTHLTSCDMGELIPINVLEVLPGDSIRMNTSALVRAAPMLAPPMHPTDVCIHHWFVPHRLVWSAWENFITGGPDGLDASVFPTMNAAAVTQGTLRNYLGLPIDAGPVPAWSALPFRSYGLIFNEWYRDQDLQTPLVVSTASGVDTTTSQALQNVNWEKDYFTVSRPWEQKGAAVSIPLSGTGAVTFHQPGATPLDVTLQRAAGGANAAIQVVQTQTGGATPNPITADVALSSAGVTVNALRQSLAIQRYQEAAAMYGSRYVEYLARLGVRSSDGRLSRPEYLGGGRQTLQFSEVLQTAADGANPVSTLRGHGISALRSNSFTRFIEEHGLIITLMYCKPKTIYTSGMAKIWNRRTKFDYWQRELENIGQQPILNKEVRARHASPDATFGYVDRYEEYRRSWSRVSGEFATSTLDFWHFARAFASDPALNSTFVTSVPTDRPFAVPASDVLYINARHSIKARRLVSAKATPRTF